MLLSIGMRDHVQCPLEAARGSVARLLAILAAIRRPIDTCRHPHRGPPCFLFTRTKRALRPLAWRNPIPLVMIINKSVATCSFFPPPSLSNPQSSVSLLIQRHNSPFMCVHCTKRASLQQGAYSKSYCIVRAFSRMCDDQDISDCFLPII